MAAKWDVTVIDSSLDEVINNATAMTLCEGEPTDLADATTAKGSGGSMLATVAVTGGDFTKQNATAGTGREFTVAQKATTVVGVGDPLTADHIAFVSGTVLLAVVETASQVLTNGNPVEYPATGTLFVRNRELVTQ